MKRPGTEKTALTSPQLDALLQDTYLLVVELRQGASVKHSPDLQERCEGQIRHTQQSLEARGVSQRSVELISYALCALLDETALSCAKDEAYHKWAAAPLQATLFNRHQAGEFLYQDMREILAQPAPDPLLLTVFQRVLMLGFCGRYATPDHPERLALLQTLNAWAAPLQVTPTLPTRRSRRRPSVLRALRSPALHVLAAGLLVGGLWWGLDRWLSSLVATLVAGQG